jgi:uncharacterized protein involved in exopolysaccharide biosynthesis
VGALSERDDNQDGEGGGGRPGFPIDPLRLWHALRGGWQIVAVATVVGAFVGAAIAKKVVKQSFEATAVIAWDSQTPIDLVTRQTTIESVTLGPNLEQVKKKMDLSMPAKDVGTFFFVTSNENSKIVNIKAMWASADGAADMANALTQAFLDSREKLARERQNSEIVRYKAAVEEAERKAREASAEYERFRREKGIVDISQERELAITAAAKLSAEAEAAKRAYEVVKAQVENMGEAPSNPQPAINSVMSEAERAQAESDAKRLPQLRSELAAARVQFADEHPTVLRLLAEQDALETRIKKRGGKAAVAVTTGKTRENLEAKMREAEGRAKQSEAAASALQEKLNKLSGVEGEAAVLLGNISVAEKTLEAAKQMLNGAELAAQKPPQEFRILEVAKPPEMAMSSPRKKVALGFPIAFLGLSLVGVILWRLRKGDVVTPKEAAFWAAAPVIGASTWPRDPDMLSSLMHDLDDFAPHCEGVTLIVGVSLDEAHLARRVAEWDGHRMPKHYDPQKLLAAGAGGQANALALRDESMAAGREDPNNMQILTLMGPVPAQALRRAARMADRVLVVVQSGKHSCLQMTRIKNRLGRDGGIGILLVGLPKEYAMVRDRVGEVEQFWHATRIAAGSRAEA